MSLRVIWTEAKEARRLLAAAAQARASAPSAPLTWRVAVRALGCALLLVTGPVVALWAGVVLYVVGPAGVAQATVGELAAVGAGVALRFGEVAALGVAGLIVPVLVVNLPGSPGALTTFEALRLPSRRGLMLARWRDMLPLLLGAGVVLAAVPWVDRGATALLAAAGGPWAPEALAWRQHTSAWPGLAALTPGLAALPGLLAAGLVLAGLLGRQPLWRFRPLWLVPAAAVALVYVCPAFHDAPPLPPGLWSALAVAALVASLAAQDWLVGHIEPWAQAQPLGATAPASARPARAARAGPLAPARPAAGKSGRFGLAPATWAYLFGGGLRAASKRFDMQFQALFFLAFAVFVPTPATGGDGVVVMRGCFLLLASLFVCGSSPPRPPHPERLYLLGVDYRAQYRFNVAAGLLSPALLLVLAVALAAGVGAERLTLLAVPASLLLVRAGWFDQPGALSTRLRLWLTPRPRLLTLALLPLLLLSCVLMGVAMLTLAGVVGLVRGEGQIEELSPHAVSVVGAFLAASWWVAGPLAALGLAGIAYRLRRDDEAELRRLLTQPPATPALAE